MPGPLLALETLAPDRPFITIDGRRYDLAVPGDFGLVESARFDRLVRECRAVDELAVDEPDKAKAEKLVLEELDRLAGEAAGMVLRAPAEVLDRLNSTQKLAVVSAFSTAAAKRARKPPIEKKARPSRSSTSGRSSSSSRRPTARRTGTTSRSASSSRT